MVKVIGALAAALSLAAAYAADGAGWKAGVARVKITPRENVWLAGYGNRDHPAEGVRQDIWAKALALEDGSGRTGVIVGIDVCAVDREFYEEFAGRIAARHGLGRDQVILNCSHTHSGPVVGGALRYIYPMSEAEREKVRVYTRWLMDALVGLVGDALADRRPARIFTGNGLARFAVNRRSNKEASIRTTHERKGQVDYSVPVLKAEGADGSTRAVLFGYACHLTVLCDYLYSGDYAGYAQCEVERMHPGATAIFFQGAGADSNPLPRRKESLAVQYGKELALAVEQALADELKEREPVLGLRYERVMLGMEKPISLEEMDSVGKDASPINYRARWARGTAAAVRGGATLPGEWPFPVQYWTIGDQKLFALGGELFAGYALAIKERYGADSFVMGYCNDVMSYIPTEDAWEKGGYEVGGAHVVYGLPARWTRDVTRRIMDAVDRIAR